MPTVLDFPNVPAIGGLDDISDARVFLFASGRQVNAPLSNIGLLTTDDAATTYLTIVNAASTYQPVDATLTTIAALTGAANKAVYFTGADVAALFDLTAAGRALLDDADADAQRTTLSVPWELISKTALSSVASWDATGLSAYRKIRVSGWARPATDAVNFNLRTSTDNGSTFDAGATDYRFGALYIASSTVTPLADLSTIAFSINNTSTVGNVAPEAIWFSIDIDDFNATEFAKIRTEAGWLGPATAQNQSIHKGTRASTTARNAIRLIFSSGNIATGYVVLEGVRG